MNSNPERNKQLQDALRAFIAEEEAKKNANKEYIKNVDIGRAMGYTTGSLISQYLNDAAPFRGNLSGFETALANYLNFGERAEEFQEKRTIPLVEENTYIPTSISQDVYNSIEYCRLTQGICILHGEAGIGKTMGAFQYAKDNVGSAYFINVQEGRLRKREIIMEITSRMGIKDARNNAERYHRIREKMHHGNKVFIFDEAHRFPLQTLEFIRDLGDALKEVGRNGVSIFDGAGVVLIGNSKVAKFIQNIKRDDMEQFRSRSFEREYFRRQTSLEDVQRIFPYLTENGMDKELKALYTISAKQSRGLRGAVSIYNHSANSGGDVSLPALQAVSRMFNVGIIEGE